MEVRCRLKNRGVKMVAKHEHDLDQRDSPVGASADGRNYGF